MHLKPNLLELFSQVATVLDECGFAYAFIGAMARNAWGRPRTTSDLDIEMSLDPTTLAELEARFGELGIIKESEIGPADSADGVADNMVFRAASGIRIDILVTKTGFQRKALERRVRHDVMGIPAWVVTLEDLLVYELIAGRSQDNADVEALLDGLRDPNHDLDWAYVEAWASAWGVSKRFAQFTLRFRRSSP